MLPTSITITYYYDLDKNLLP